MKATVAYYRSSTKMQENSIKMQRNTTDKYAKEHAIAIHRHYEDPGTSARLTAVSERPQMMELIQSIRNGEVGTVLAYKRDRLARNAVQYMEFYRLCKAYGVQILFSAEGEFPLYFTPLGEFIELIMAGMVQHEAEQLAERMTNTQRTNFLNGTMLGRLPYGLVEEIKNEKPVPEYASTEVRDQITRIYEDLVNLQPNSMREFLKHLNNDPQFQRMQTGDTESNPASRVPSRKWTADNLATVIPNTLFKGVHTRYFADQPFTYQRPECRIVSNETWEQANEIFNRIKTEPPREEPAFTFILEHLLFCSVCQKPLSPFMSQSKGKWIPVYRCEKHHVKLIAEDAHEVVSDTVLDHIEKLFAEHGAKYYRRYQEKIRQKLRSRIREQERVVGDLEQQFTEAVTRELHTSFTQDDVLDELNEIHQRLETARKTLFQLETDLKDSSLLPHITAQRQARLQELKRIVSDKTNQYRIKELLIEVVDKIVVEGHHIISPITLKVPFRIGVDENACS